MTTDNMSKDFQQNHPRQISEALRELVNEVDRHKAADGSSKLAGIETGFTDLDRITSGMRPGSLIVIASRPSMGKSTLALNIASHVALNAKLPVLIFSMEMSAIAVASKLVSQIGKIEMRKLRNGELDEIGRMSLDAAQEKLRDAPLFIDETSSLTTKEIIARSQVMIAQQGRLGLIVIDYLQLMEPITSGNSSSADYQAVMSSLRTLARETDTPVILLSQLNRKMEKRRNKRPRMPDLPTREIGQYSDLLMFIYRDECYAPHSPDKNTAEITIGRHRYGSIGMAILGTMKLKFSEFSNFDS